MSSKKSKNVKAKAKSSAMTMLGVKKVNIFSTPSGRGRFHVVKETNWGIHYAYCGLFTKEKTSTVSATVPNQKEVLCGKCAEVMKERGLLK
jgi:hypothetical protein